MNENELIKSAIAGDADAFERLVAAYEKPIYNYCLRMLCDAEDARDATQDVFLKLYRNLAKYRSREGASFKSWVYRLANNTCIDAIRRKKARIAPDSLDAAMETDDGALERQVGAIGDTPEDAVLMKERQAAIRRAIDALPTEFRQMITLRDLQGLSYEEITQITGIKPGTVKSKINRARGKLRELIQKNYV